MNAPSRITPELVAAHGLKPDEYQRILDLIGREPTLHRARHLLGDVERALLVQILEEVAAHAADHRAARHPGTGRECRRGRHRRRRLAVVFKMESHNHPSYIEPYQGAATGVGGILRDVFTMGARPIAAHERAALRRARPSEDPPSRRRRRRRHRRLRQFLRRADGRRRGQFRRALQRQHPRQRLRRRHRQDRRDLLLEGQGRRPAGRLSRRQDRPRRRRRRHHGLGRVRRRHRGEAPDRAGRRSLHRKAACSRPASN